MKGKEILLVLHEIKSNWKLTNESLLGQLDGEASGDLLQLVVLFKHNGTITGRFNDDHSRFSSFLKVFAISQSHDHTKPPSRPLTVHALLQQLLMKQFSL